MRAMADASSGALLCWDSRETNLRDRVQKSLELGLGHLETVNYGEAEGRGRPVLVKRFTGFEHEQATEAIEELLDILEPIDAYQTDVPIGTDRNIEGFHGLARSWEIVFS